MKEYLNINSPIKTINGGKGASGAAQQIINRVPKHDLYFELFLGRGEIVQKKALADFSFCFEKDNEIIEKWAARVIHPKFKLINGDAISFLEMAWPLLNYIHNNGHKIFIYADPPYLFSTRRSGSYKKLYTHELSEDDHKRLLSILIRLECYVMISSYYNDLYFKFLIARNGWAIHQFSVQTRNGKARECIFFNYKDPANLHDFSYLGKDYRDRARIKAVKNRTIGKFLRMPPAQRTMIINELNKKFNENISSM